MAIIGFGAATGHPRPHLQMIDDSFLEIGSGNTEAAIARLRLKCEASSRVTGRSYLLGPQRLEVALVGPDEAAQVFHVAHSKQVGWVVDVHDSVDSVTNAVEASLERDCGPLRLHGEYFTDGVDVYRGANEIERVEDVKITSDMLPDLPGVAEWRIANPSKVGIVGLLLPELSIDALVSYKAVAKATGIGASTLRAYVSRYEGNQIPYRQGSTETGQPVWSRAVIEEWAERRSEQSRNIR